MSDAADAVDRDIAAGEQVDPAHAIVVADQAEVGVQLARGAVITRLSPAQTSMHAVEFCGLSGREGLHDGAIAMIRRAIGDAVAAAR